MNIKVKRKANKETKGITLVALVITIVVMLILAGVAISMTINSDGLFSKANTAGESWNTAVENERSELQDLLDNLGVEEPTTISTELPKGKDWDLNKVSAVVTQGTRTAPIPKGYTVSGIDGENTIRSGLVIYETRDEDTTAEGFWTNTDEIDGKEYLTCQTTYNQYVWIPVDNINYMVMCKSKSSASQCNLVLQANGTLKCETHDSTDLCGRVYSVASSNETVDGKKVWTYAMSFTAEERASQTWDTSSDHEPNIVSYCDKDSNTSYLTAAGVSTANELLTQLTNDFTAMATSVAKYGGFYVSRYEAGANGASKKNQQVLVAGTTTVTGYDSNTYINGNMWYGMYNTLKNNTGVDTNVVNTHMIWGSQYDQIINFLETNPNNEPQIAHTDRQLATQVKTGSNEADVMSNIYDLEGNNHEWTAQAGSSCYRSLRGGYFNLVADSSYFYPASSRFYNYPSNTGCVSGSRCTLYIR